MKLVIVEWQDSRQPHGGWNWLDDCRTPQPVRCLTVGWLLKKTKDAVLIAQSLGDIDGEREQFSGGTEIARRQIVRMKEIAWARPHWVGQSSRFASASADSL